MLRLRKQETPTRRRGATIVLTAVSLVTLLICASLAIDVGYICALTAEAQNTSDAGALGGAEMLQRKEFVGIHGRVLELVSTNQKRQGFAAPDDQIIEFGKWDSKYQKFYPLASDEWEKNAFAVRVRAVRNKAQLFFAAVAGHTSTNVWREAIAVGSRPCKGIWGLNGVRVVGDVTTDSFNSDEGPYTADTAGEEGDICSGRGVAVNGSVEVHGDVMAGYGYPIDINGDPLITGMTSSTIQGLSAPAPEFGDIKTANDNLLMPNTAKGAKVFSAEWDFAVGSNDSLVVPPGNYYLRTMAVHSTATITFTGATTLYVQGSIAATGAGLINETGDPSNLKIISSGTSVSIGGTFDLFAEVLAPYADVKLSGDGDLYGALIGKTVTMVGNFQVHVDESSDILDLLGDPPPPFLVK
ncbi:MAG: pilus assembly protein TadG-related protein [Planctomycetota bacterium]|mgnify:CR=1 FL=1